VYCLFKSFRSSDQVEAGATILNFVKFRNLSYQRPFSKHDNCAKPLNMAVPSGPVSNPLILKARSANNVKRIDGKWTRISRVTWTTSTFGMWHEHRGVQHCFDPTSLTKVEGSSDSVGRAAYRRLPFNRRRRPSSRRRMGEWRPEREIT
jgi:hypothetical protein